MGRRRNVDQTQELAKTYREYGRPKARGGRFSRAEHHRNYWSYFAAPGSKLNEHLEPHFWTPIVGNLRPLDRIEISEELGAWVATLLVKSIGNEVDVLLIGYVAIGGISEVGSKPGMAPGYRITFGGLHSQWAVYQGETLMLDGLPNEKSAEVWLEDHVAQIDKKGAAA